MYCSHCGKEIPDNSKFCPHCGSLVDFTTVPNHSNPDPVQRINNASNRKNNAAADYSRIIVIISCIMMLIAAFFPVLKINYIYDSEGKSIVWVAEQGISDGIVFFFVLTEICSVVTLISHLSNSNNKKFGSFAGIATFVMTMIYYIELNNKGTADYYIADFKVDAGPVIMLIFSIVILIFSILSLVQNNNRTQYYNR